MPYTEPKSTDVWYNMAGCVAAYQPIAAPDAISARQNVASGLARLGQYTAAPGTAPAFNPAAGWIFNGSTQYLKSGIVPESTSWSYLVRFSNASGTGTRLFGAFRSATYAIYIQPDASSGAFVQYANHGTATGLNTAPAATVGVFGIAKYTKYRNGAPDGTIAGADFASTPIELYIGGINQYGIGQSTLISACIQSFAAYSRTLTAAEVFQASKQMKYCDQNPDWSAWGRRRRWYYAAVPGAVGIHGARATMALPGGVSIRPTGGQS